MKRPPERDETGPGGLPPGEPQPKIAVSPIDTANLGESIYRQIGNALIVGSLRPGDRLKIRDLAVQMGTSVTPVRDAILRLVQEGALVAKSPRDVRVPALQVSQYMEIRTIRVHLEGVAAAEAARKALKTDVLALEELIRLNEDAIRQGDLAGAAALNQRFHFALVDIARMPILRDVLRGLWLRTGPLIAATYKPAEPAIIAHHYEVLAAVRNGDPLSACNAIQTDIVDGTRTIMELGFLEAG